MKRVVKHPDPSAGEPAGPQYWRSLDEVADTPGFREYLEREFPEGASSIEGVDRRHFIKIMAASFALGGLGMAGCRRPESRILPYAEAPERIVPGRPLYYASSMPLRGAAVPVLVETHQARPTKVEGNPSYPPHRGKSDLISQASVLNLYDPDRARQHTRGTARLSDEEVADLLDDVGREYGENGGEGLAFLAEYSSSPTRRILVAELKEKFPKAIWAEYEPVDEAYAERAASRMAGEPVRPHYHPGRAKRILALDSDFLHEGDGHIYHGLAFADGRRVKEAGDPMNRLYAVESAFSVTGGMADHRLRLSASHLPAFACRLAARVLTHAGVDGALAEELASLGAGLDVDEAWIDECAKDLADHAGESLLVAGAHLPEPVQAIALYLNQVLGNIGGTVDLLKVEQRQGASIQDLSEAISADRVDTLFVLGGNPVHNAPADLDWKELQERVDTVIRYGYYQDETSEAADYHLTALHYLESWGDARAADGTVLPVQPMILPLFRGMTELELLARVLRRETRDPYDLVFAAVTGLKPDQAPERVFRRFLHDGLLAESAYETLENAFSASAVRDLLADADFAPPSLSVDNLEVRLVRDARVDDGRFINNGWLQECPDPISKNTWDNAIMISSRLARELDLVARGGAVRIVRRNPNRIHLGRQVAPIVELEVNGNKISGPVHIQPGLPDYTVIVPVGYGRQRTGRVGSGVGFDAYPLKTVERPFVSTGVSLMVTGETMQLANVQEHWSMEGRAIIREGNKDYFDETPDFASRMGMESHAPPNFGPDRAMPRHEKATRTPRGYSLYEHPEFEGIHQWGMTIDMNTCIGCNACVVACQSENNIPIVGKDQVLRGREMHWIRIDRYYSSGPEAEDVSDEPQMSLQPMLCQHCENAPCETVCPVNATVHDDEGLNVMAYNRCIGTRYCANNCPYKVRRFNFFDWNQREIGNFYHGPLAPKGMDELHKMQKNPDVTVRMRGVMEKCTFCTQRIERAKIDQKVKAGASDDVEVPDGTFQVACQQACPTEAIAFGNIADPDSEVSRWKNSDRDYSVLGYLNTRPRTTYLAKLRNPNPLMPDYGKRPLSAQEYYAKNYPNGGAEQ